MGQSLPVRAFRQLKRALFAACVLLSSASAADTPAPPENSLKAALIYKIMAYVTWPDSAFDAGDSSPFKVCEYGKNPLDGALVSLTRRRAAGRSIELVSLADDELPESLCHVLFVDSDSPVRSTVSQVSTRPVLTVSDGKTFARSGGMIEIRKDRNRFGFWINRGAAVDAGLLIAAPLLELSTLVEGDGE